MFRSWIEKRRTQKGEEKCRPNLFRRREKRKESDRSFGIKGKKGGLVWGEKGGYPEPKKKEGRFSHKKQVKKEGSKKGLGRPIAHGKWGTFFVSL